MQLEATIAAQNETIVRKDAEIKRLKKALRTLLNSDDERSDKGSSARDADDSDTLSAEGGLDSEDENLPEPFRLDWSYHCVECGWEVVDGTCSQCGLEHEWTSEHELKEENAPYNGDNLAINWDRSLVPRGHTPLLHGPFLVPDLDDEDSAPESSRLQEVNSYLEYFPLLARGATISMCERYQLEYTYEGGIYAWADEDLMDEFSGATMEPGDHWKIHLGRQITLVDKDTDGQEFIEDLLEDAVLFPLRSDLHPRMYERWQTTEEAPGVWVTRLIADRKEEADNSDWESDAGDNDLEYEAVTSRGNAAIEPDAPTVPEGPIRSNTYFEAEYEGEDADASQAIIADENDSHDVDYRLRDDPDTAWDSDDSSYYDPESSPSESGDEEQPIMDAEYLEDLGRRIGALAVAQQEREAMLEDSD
ncbi:hypothetical protein D9619_009324 [Psilocybe cf. subviscida]|uniref:DUF8191 domain-containing protein n=1 Tax=Psilocybe cf. subviscida TaxID=2480587 RepID=A0A8H5BUZ9_9AGAR|nr:hypothetical protein D9619_009324 [Psilocybe cf. subviscida]